MLLPCRTKLQFGLTVARQESNSDSDVVPESNQIQDLLKPRNNSPPNARANAISPKHIYIIYEVCLVRQKHDVRIAAVLEWCSTAELLAKLNSKI